MEITRGTCEKDSAGRMDGTTDRPKAPNRKYLPKLKMPQFVRPKPKQKTNPPKGTSLPATVPEKRLTFLEMLDQKLLAEASRVLIIREDQVFRRGSENPDPQTLSLAQGSQGGGGGEEEEQEAKDEGDDIQKDLEALLVQVWIAVHATFPPSISNPSSEEDMHILRSAVCVIQQQELQDKRWTEQENEENNGGASGGGGASDGGRASSPDWRPVECLQTHRKLLTAMVESRLRLAALVDNQENATRLSTAGKRELCSVGKGLRDDLLEVARNVTRCYPEEMDILKLYVQLYHQAFSGWLRRLARSGLGVDECSYLLYWVNDYYPKEILNHKELQAAFCRAEMGALIPKAELTQLEDQYLRRKEAQVGTWLGSALAREQESWQRGPEKMDQYWFSPLAVDTLQIVNSAVSEARSLVSEPSAAQRITAQLQPFLANYRKALEEFTKRNHNNSTVVMKANLVCILQLRCFLEKEEGLSGDQGVGAGSRVKALEDWGYGVLASPIHLKLKTKYKLLWSGSWMAGAESVLFELLDSLEAQLCQLTDLKPSCKEILLGKLHEEVLVEYVRRMMKGKVLMKNKEEQEQAAKLLCDHGNKIHAFFSNEGSGRADLEPILSRIAELLRLQDKESLQLEVAAMAMDYPDLRRSHIAALMSLKSNLLASNARIIKQLVPETFPQPPSANHSVFFSRVRVKWSTGLTLHAL